MASPSEPFAFSQMCRGISNKRVLRPIETPIPTPDPKAPPTTSAPQQPKAGCAIGASCCVAWDVILPRKRGTEQQPTATTAAQGTAGARSDSGFPTPPRAAIRRLAVGRSKSDPSMASSSGGPGVLATIVESLEEEAARPPSILARLTRTLSGAAAATVGHAYSIDDGYDSEEDEEISEALFREVSGNLNRARKRNYATLRWRAKHEIDEVLDDPHPELERVLACWPRWLQGTAKDGSLLWYEQLGRIDAGRLRRERLGHHDVMARHVGLLCEYVTQCLDPHGAWRDPYSTFPRPKVTVVWDLAGMTAGKWADLAVRKAVRAWGDVLAAHYPGLVQAILVVNCPPYAPPALALLQPLVLLPKSLRATVQIVGANGLGGAVMGPPLASLAEAIDPLTLPVAFAGGENPEAPEAAVEWKGLLRLLRRNRRYHEYVGKREEGKEE